MIGCLDCDKLAFYTPRLNYAFVGMPPGSSSFYGYFGVSGFMSIQLDQPRSYTSGTIGACIVIIAIIPYPILDMPWSGAG